MSATLRQPHPASDVRLALGTSHGYRIEGDTAILHAAPTLPPTLEAASLPDLALQLWACDAPFAGGALRGVKIAEAPLSLPSEHGGLVSQLETRSFAQLPAGQRDFAMVLVLASGARGVYDQVEDFANYVARQRFLAPFLEGSVGYRIEGNQLTLEADRVCNPRLADNLSGTLALELWALSEPYEGGGFAGTRLAQVELAPLHGQEAHCAIAARTELLQPPAGSWQLTLMLREWTGAEGFLTRDYRNFAAAYVAEAAARPSPAETAAPRGAAPSPTALLGARKLDGPLSRDALKRPTPVRAADAPRLVAVPPLPTGPATRLSVQHASLEELGRVPGLNRKLAAAIVRARPLHSLDELKRVRGIGDKLLRALRAHLTV